MSAHVVFRPVECLEPAATATLRLNLLFPFVDPSTQCIVIYLHCQRLVKLSRSFRPATPATTPQAIYRAASFSTSTLDTDSICDLNRIRFWNSLDERTQVDFVLRKRIRYADLRMIRPKSMLSYSAREKHGVTITEVKAKISADRSSADRALLPRHLAGGTEP